MEFEEWLAAQDLSVSSIKKYAGAIDGPLTDWGNQGANNRRALRTITDPQEFAAISELIEGTEIFSERNTRGKHMYGAALNNYAQYLAARADKSASADAFSKALRAIEAFEDGNAPFEPKGQIDGRDRVLREVIRRRGQPQFRAKLISAYQARCAITCCPLLAILEAAHITPYLGPETNQVSNGLLLRADIHTLWDLGLIAIDPTTTLLAVSPRVNDAVYQSFSGKPIYQPTELASRPSFSALQQQWEIFQNRS